MEFSDIMDVDYNHAEVLLGAIDSFKNQDRVITIYCQNLQEIKVSKFLLCMFSETVRNIVSTESYYCVPQANIFLPDCSLKSIKYLLQLIMTGFINEALYEDMTDLVETAKLLLIDISDISFYKKEDIVEKDEEAFDPVEIEDNDKSVTTDIADLLGTGNDNVSKCVITKSLSVKTSIKSKLNEAFDQNECKTNKNDYIPRNEKNIDKPQSYSENEKFRNMVTQKVHEEIMSVPNENDDYSEDIQINDTIISYTEVGKPKGMKTNETLIEMVGFMKDDPEDMEPNGKINSKKEKSARTYKSSKEHIGTVEGGKIESSVNENLKELLNETDTTFESIIESDITSESVNTKELVSDTTCQLCNTECYNIFNLWQHYSNTHFYTQIKTRYGYLIENNQCTICKKSFSTTPAGIQHLAKTHQKVNDILKLMKFEQVPPCKDYSYKSLPNTKSTENTKVVVAENKFKCSNCTKSFADNSKLKVHSRLHTGQKPFPCNKCTKSFSQIGNLQAHGRIHSNKKPYSCKKCDKSFKQLTHLNQHNRTHTGDNKPYSCEKCEQSFKQLSHLNQHNRTHTGERPFPCEFCNRSYRQAYTLIIHKRIHTGEKPYKCDQCIDTFPSSTVPTTPAVKTQVDQQANVDCHNDISQVSGQFANL